MQLGSVVEIVDLFLALLGQLNIKHVYREVELGLGLFEVLLVKSITSNPSTVYSQHEQWIILHAVSSNVMTDLLAVAGFVLVLWKKLMKGKEGRKERQNYVQNEKKTS